MGKGGCKVIIKSQKNTTNQSNRLKRCVAAWETFSYKGKGNWGAGERLGLFLKDKKGVSGGFGWLGERMYCC